jgi:hypothetical protein
MYPEGRKITVFDNGDGIPPEDLEAVGKAGASTVREEDAAAPITGALKIEEKTGTTATTTAAARSKLGAKWGKYGIGRFAQLRDR